MNINIIWFICLIINQIKKIPIIEWLKESRAHVIYIAKRFAVDDIAIEQFIQFMKGKSSAKAIIPLAILNTTLQLAVSDILNKKTTVLSVLKIRHCLKLTKKLPSKTDMPTLVAHHLGIEFPWITKINRRTKVEENITENEDMADATAVAICRAKTINNPIKPRKKTARKKKG